MLDPGAIAMLRQLGGDELVDELIDRFLDRAPLRIETMRAGERAGDLATVSAQAHSLKSAAGQLGAANIRQLAARIEAVANGHSEGDIMTVVDELELAYRDLQDGVDSGRV